MSSNQWLDVTVYDPYGNNPEIELKCQYWNTIKDVKEKLYQKQQQLGKRIIHPEDMIITDFPRKNKQVQKDSKKLSDLFNQSLVMSEQLQVFSSQEMINIYDEFQQVKVIQMQKEQKQFMEKQYSPTLKQSLETNHSTEMTESLVQNSLQEIQFHQTQQGQQNQFGQYQRTNSTTQFPQQPSQQSLKK